MPILAVSPSRISPTMMTSGSWRRNERRAEAKVRPIAGFTWVWLTPGISYSIGSSMVRILRIGAFRMRQRGGERRRLAAAGRAGDDDQAVRRSRDAASMHGAVARAESRGGRNRAGRWLRSSTRRIAALRRARVGMVATRISSSDLPTRTRARPSCGRRRSAMLRPARIFTREITIARAMSGRRRVDRAQQAIDAQANLQGRRGTARYECRWRAVRRRARTVR